MMDGGKGGTRAGGRLTEVHVAAASIMITVRFPNEAEVDVRSAGE